MYTHKLGRFFLPTPPNARITLPRSARSIGYLLRLPWALVLSFTTCAPDPDPGQLGGPCVDQDVCDFGLACRAGICERGDEPTGVATGGAGGATGSAGAANAGGVSGTAMATGGTSAPGGGNMAGSSSPGGSSGGTSAMPPSGGGTSSNTSSTDAGTPTSGGGGASVNCVGLPAARGRCNDNACLCPPTNQCFPASAAAACCSVAPQCR